MRRIGVLVLIAIAACSTQTGSGDGYELSEWEIEGPARLAQGPTTFHVQNSGDFPHTLVVTTPAGEVVGATGVISPGSNTALDLDLEAGTYSFSCRIVSETPDGSLSDHYERGMHQTVVVRSGS